MLLKCKCGCFLYSPRSIRVYYCFHCRKSYSLSDMIVIYQEISSDIVSEESRSRILKILQKKEKSDCK